LFIAKIVAEEQYNAIIDSGFDGIYTWHGAKRDYSVANPDNWKNLAIWAETNSLIFIPTVSPGYNDIKYNLGYIPHVAERKKGETYSTAWQAAIESKAPIVSINSFNQWHLGTQIEPAQPFKETGETSDLYLNYEGLSSNYYLELTRKFTSKYFLIHKS